VTAFNKYYGWYYGEPEDNAEFFDSIHKRFPTQSVAVSEYGAGGAITQHEAVNYGGPGYQRTPMESPRRVAFAKFHPEEYQAYYHEEAWKALAARPYIWAKFIWNMFDFASDGRSEGDHPGRNDKGLVSFDRKTRKDAFYFYQANWTTSPVLHLNGKRFLQRATPEADVKVYTNAAEAELFLNGQSVGKASANDIHVARWQGLHLVPGRNTVRVQASFAAGIQTDECVWELVPAAKAP
jgi:beta-galactosidase